MALDDFPAGRQGRRSRFEPDLIATLDLVVSLGALGVPAARAADLARELQTAGEVKAGRGLVLTYSARGHRADLDSRLRDAAERVVARKRGRPARTRRAASSMPSENRGI